MHMLNLTDESIIWASKNSQSASEASRLLGISYKAYKTRAEKLGVFHTNQSGKGTHKKRDRTYRVNDTIFSQIDSADKAYWLGFLAADGSVVDNSLKLMLSAIDDLHLRKFLDFLDSDYPIGYCDSYYTDTNGTRHSFDACYIKITSSSMIADISKYGIVQGKKYKNIDFISNIPDRYKLDFICGIFDGDGSVGVYNNRLNISLALNDATSKSVCNILESIDIKVHTRTRKTFNVLYIQSTDSVRKFYSIYSSSANAMYRKLLIFLDHII